MSCLEKAQQLVGMISEGKTMEAIQELYHDDVVVVEQPTGETRNGKAAQMEAMKQWYASIKERHGGGFGTITSNEEDQTTSIESWVDITTEHGRMKMEEVGVQKWKDGKIIHERFYYNMPGQ